MNNSNNNINFLIKLKNEVNIHKISYFSGRCFKGSYDAKYKKIITKKSKQFKTIYCVPVIFINKIMYHIKKLAIDNLKLDLNFHYFDISPLMQLTTLIYLLKFINIKKITLRISIYEHHCPRYELFCKSLKHILQKYCKDMDVVINYYFSSPCFIKKLGAGVNIIDKHCATINKFKVNHHRNYQLKNRVD